MKARQIGDNAEQQAELFLSNQGLRLVERNFLCKVGEIDLIMQHEDKLVFVEVRFRKNAHFGSALETVNIKKQKKIIAAAQYYLLKHANSQSAPFRFDVVGITGNDIQWVPSAFQGV